MLTINFHSITSKYRGLLRSGFWVYLSYGINAISGIFILWLLTNYLSKDDFGVYRYVIGLIPIANTLALSGTVAFITKQAARDPQYNIRNIALMKIRFGFLSVIAGVGLFLWYSYFGNHTLALAFLFVLVGIPLADSLGSIQPYLHGTEQFKKTAIYELSIKALLLATYSVCALVFPHVLIFLLLFIGVPLSVWSYAWIKEHQGGNSPQSLSKRDKSEIINITTSGLLFTLIPIIDKLIVWHLLGSQAMAEYGLAFSLLTQILGLCSGVLLLSMPRLSRYNWQDSNIWNQLKKNLCILFFVTTVLSIIIVYVLPAIYQILFSDFSSSVSIGQIAVLGIAPGLLLLFLRQILVTRESSRVLTISACISLLCFIVFVALLIHLKTLGIMLAFVLKDIPAIFYIVNNINRSNVKNKEGQ